MKQITPRKGSSWNVPGTAAILALAIASAIGIPGSPLLRIGVFAVGAFGALLFYATTVEMTYFVGPNKLGARTLSDDAQVRLVGGGGRVYRIRVGGFFSMDGDVSLRAVAQELAESLERPFMDFATTPEEEAHFQETGIRICAGETVLQREEFEAMVERNRSEFSFLYRNEPTEPEVQRDLHGVTWTLMGEQITLNDMEVRGLKTVPLTAILGVAYHNLRREQASIGLGSHVREITYTPRLVACTADGPVVLARGTAQSPMSDEKNGAIAAQYRFVAEEIQRAADASRESLPKTVGTRDNVPEALVRMRSAASEVG